MTIMVKRPLPPDGAGQPPVPMRRPTQAAAPSRGMTGQDLLRALRRRWKLVAGFLFGFTILSVAATVLWYVMWPEYTAQSVVQVAPPRESVLRATPYRNAEILDRYKQNVANLVRQEFVLRNALEREQMQRTAWFREMHRRDPEWNEAIKELRKMLVVRPIPESDQFSVQMSMYCGSREAKEQLPTIVNQVTEALIAEVTSDERRERDQAVQTFRAAREEQRRQLRQLRAEIANRMRTTEVPAMARQVDALSVEVNELIKANNLLLSNRADLEKGLAGMQQQRREGLLASNPVILRALETDPILRQLEGNLTGSRAMMEIVRSKYGPDHEQRRTLEIRIQGLQGEIEAYRAELIQSNIQSMLMMYEQELAKTIDMLTTNAERLDGLQERRRDLNNTLIEIESMEGEAKQLSDSIANLEERLTDLQMVREGGELQATLRARATVPIEPSGPRLPVWISLGVLLGAGLGVGLALLLELTDQSVKTPTDVTARADLPLLAMIPHADDMDEEIEDYRLACLAGDHSMVTEAFRECWTNLQFSGPLEGRRSLLITSASPYDGRTCVAVNLALTVAQSGRRVLLVDTNFRRPALTELFPSTSGHGGLSDALSGQAQWAECVQQTQTPNLAVLHAGKMPPNPAELFSSELGKQILAEMREQYDQVILDSAPLLLINDAKVVATNVDGVVVVVRAGANTYGIVQRCRQILLHLGAHIVGGVLNGVRTTAGGYLQKNYDAFHEYQDGQA